MRLSIDTGGTFTDLVVESERDGLQVHKRPTTPDDPVRGILDVIAVAASTRGMTTRALLGATDTLVHATTRSLNALLVGETARTALLVTAGHPDVLVLREGGREHFNARAPYPEPFVPRSSTFEVPERIGAAGEVVLPLDERKCRALVRSLRDHAVEAVAVCLLWSVANPVHEQQIGEVLREELPGVPFTLSHEINPSLREYRRASSASIDAALKPLMQLYLLSLEGRLREAGFEGRLLMVTSSGALLDAAAVAAAPIHSIKSGPAMAPVAGRRFAARDGATRTAIVADTGGTSYDVSLVRDGVLPWTRETWLGARHTSHMTGFPSVDVRSYGAGGGSIASVDDGGLLRVGPESAGAAPGPAAYGQGGVRPTFTDASLTLGHLDPARFLGGTMHLDALAASEAIEAHVARPLGLDVPRAAAAIVEVITEQMVRAIEETALLAGVDPREAALVGGGGAAGLNSVGIARRLGCRRVLFPAMGAALSAAGGLMSDLASDFGATFSTTSDAFDHSGVEDVVAGLVARAERFVAEAGHAEETRIEVFAEAHYPREVWEIEVPVPLPSGRIRGGVDVDALCDTFHRLHRDLFSVADPAAPVQFVGWRVRGACKLRSADPASDAGAGPPDAAPVGTRRAYFSGPGWVDAPVRDFGSLPEAAEVAGPAFVDSPVTTIVIDPGATARRTRNDCLVVEVLPARSHGHRDSAGNQGKA